MDSEVVCDYCQEKVEGNYALLDLLDDNRNLVNSVVVHISCAEEIASLAAEEGELIAWHSVKVN